MDSAEPDGEAPGDDEAHADDTAHAGDGGPLDDAVLADDALRADDEANVADDEPADEEAAPSVEQRFSPWLTVRTTLHAQGLVVEVSRPFRQRVAAVDFDRLVLEPAAVTSLRRGLLWSAAGLFGVALLLTLQPLTAWCPMWVAPALLALAALGVVVVAISPRRVTMFLDREQALHPIFLRDRGDEPAIADFVEQTRRAAIAWRCRPAAPEDEEAEAAGPRLADTLDALLAMRQEDLITDGELQRFREMAQRR